MGKVKEMYQDRLDKAYSRGSMDFYYWREFRPHIWLDSMGRDVVPEDRMTAEEVAAYRAGYDEETDRKDWGDDDV